MQHGGRDALSAEIDCFVDPDPARKACMSRFPESRRRSTSS
jgi:hypothetical protein